MTLQHSSSSPTAPLSTCSSTTSPSGLFHFSLVRCLLIRVTTHYITPHKPQQKTTRLHWRCAHTVFCRSRPRVHVSELQYCVCVWVANCDPFKHFYLQAELSNWALIIICLPKAQEVRHNSKSICQFAVYPTWLSISIYTSSTSKKTLPT